MANLPRAPPGIRPASNPPDPTESSPQGLGISRSWREPSARPDQQPGKSCRLTPGGARRGLRAPRDRVIGRPTPENVHYLAAKRDRAGHVLEFDVMAPRVPGQD